MTELAALLADARERAVAAIAMLREQHYPDDRELYCVACSTPGVRYVRWPCDNEDIRSILLPLANQEVHSE